MSIEEALEEVNQIPNKKATVPAGPPWTLIATCTSFEDANRERGKVKSGYTKIRRRTNGTFTVHTRDICPGGVVTKK